MTGKQFMQRFAEIKSEVTTKGEAALQQSETIRLAEYLVRFALAFVLARGELMGGIAPFSIGLVGAAAPGLGGLFTLVGSMLGYLLGRPIVWSLKYITTALLIYTALYVFRDIVQSKREWFAPLLALVLSACTGFVYLADAEWAFLAVSQFLAELALIGLSAYLFKIALSPWPDESRARAAESLHRTSVFFLLSALLVSLSGIRVFEIISLGRAAGILIVMLSAYKGGAGIGCQCAAAMGALFDLQSGGAPYCTMVFCLSALIANLFSRKGRLHFILAYTVTNTLAVLWDLTDAAAAGILYEVFIASVTMVLLPDSFLAWVGALFPTNVSGYGILKAREYTKERTERTAAAFAALYETVRTASGGDKNDNDAATVFDAAAEKLCRTCPRASKCWQQDYETTLSVLNDITPRMMENGKVAAADFPEHFSEACRDMEGFAEAINYELRGMLYRRQYKNRLLEKQGTAYKQYTDIANLLKNLSKELGSSITFEPLLERRLHKYLRGLNIDAAAAVFRDHSGRLHIEIKSRSLYLLKREKNYLDKLSAVVGTRLCTSSSTNTSDKMILLEAEPYAVSVGVASVKKEGQDTSGDRGTYFKTDDGIFYILLSDGMGTGGGAAACSESAVRLLKQFLTAGVAPEIALRIFNDLMLLKNEYDTYCATIDLMCIDLFTGEARIFKFGAAPSYIKKGARVHSVNCKNFAAGLGSYTDDDPELTKLKLDCGAWAVIVSDGILGGGDDKWLKETIAGYSGTSPKALSRSILAAASGKFGYEDDMTVLAVCMSERK